MKALITGSVGFIGYHIASRLLEMRAMRLARLAARKGYLHDIGMLEDRDALGQLFARFRPDIVIHLADIRESIEEPDAFVSANMIGTFNLLEC